MIFTTVDIETTGLNPHSSDIIQFAYMRTDEFGNFYGGETLMFYYPGTSASWSQEAEAVHNIHIEDLKKHADEFDTNCKKMWIMMYMSNVVTFNGNSFDLRFIKNWFQRIGYPMPLEEKSFDIRTILKEHGISGKLTSICEKLGLTPDLIKALSADYFNDSGSAHTAHYDVVATWTLAKMALSKKWIVLPSQIAENDDVNASIFEDKPFYEDYRYYIKDINGSIFEVALCPDREKYAYYKREVFGIDDSKIPFKEGETPGLFECDNIAIRVTLDYIKMGVIGDV